MSKFLSKQTIEKQQFYIFVRDLASDVTTNIKHMIEDTCKEQPKQVKHPKKKQKKVVLKKKDIIIQQQNEIRLKKNIQDDKQKITYLLKHVDPNHLFEPLSKLKSNKGKLHYKFLLLKKLWTKKKEYMDTIILLYFHLKEESLTDEYQEIIDTIESKIANQPLKEYMMKEMGHLLPPLQVWDNHVKEFDPWQKNVIQHIKHNKSVIVKAPTSSGKSFIAMASGILHKKILYVCPAKPVVYQVGAQFIHMGYKVHFLVDNLSHYSYDSKTNIFIGTPLEIESQLPKLGTEFDYAVFDEIHNLNSETDGDVYENILKIINCNFLALSATIQNVSFLQDIFQKIHPHKQIEYVEYNKRFLNQQKWVWKNNKLVQLHPLCAYPSMLDNFHQTSLRMTPRDCSHMWDIMEDVFEDTDELEECSPDEYFSESKLLTLDDCSKYEDFLKQKLFTLQTTHPQEVQEVFDEFQFTYQGTSPQLSDFYKLLKECKNNDLFPMLMFHTDEETCKSLFNDFSKYLEDKELEEYPFHYEILEKKEELFQQFTEKLRSFESNLTIRKNSNNSTFEKNEKIEQFTRKEKDVYVQSILTFYEQKIGDINRSDVDSTIKELQTKNISREMNEFLLHPDFCQQDVFKKHSDFIFTITNEPMSADTIRNVRREIMKTLGIKISYESPIFQMLKRGIGLYIESMPDEYNWIIQKLLTKKLISVVISDKTLCLGIDLPVRTSCFIGIDKNTFSKDEYLQMSGRAGRRGKDNQGNIIFFGDIDYLSLMKGVLPDITGSVKELYQHYSIYDYDSTFENIIHSDRQIIRESNYNPYTKHKKLLWSLRIYPNACQFIEEINQELESKLYSMNDNDSQKYMIELCRVLIDKDILQSYQLKKITSYINYLDIQQYMNICISVYNTLNEKEFHYCRKCVSDLFTIFNKMSFSYIL
jgi:superfamily II RNA helicase